MPAEQRGQVIGVGKEPTVKGRSFKSQRKAAAFVRWHEPDDARVSRPESVSGSGRNSPGRLGRPRGRVRLTNLDRWFFIQLYRRFPAILTVFSQSFGPRRSCVGTEPDFAAYMRAMRVKKFFRDQHFFSSYVSRGLARAQFCIDGTAGLCLTAKARAERQ